MHTGHDENTPLWNRVSGKAVIVAVAGAVGNGWATAYIYAKEDTKVFCADHRLDTAEDTVDLIRKGGGAETVIEADVTYKVSVDSMVKKLRKRLCQRWCFPYNIGGQGTGRWLDTIAVDDWNEIFARNVTTAMIEHYGKDVEKRRQERAKSSNWRMPEKIRVGKNWCKVSAP